MLGRGPLGELHVVTGAFGYSGKYIAAKLLQAGYRVRTLTNSVNRAHPFQDRIETYPLAFDHTDQLVEALRGANVLYNTYWVRFNHTEFQHTRAVENTLNLFEAAIKAGVQRIVHVSITNPDEDSHLEYVSGKARLERALLETGISYAILRPAVIFGREDILINNIAWILRKFPVFGVFGDGLYRLQPIYVGDLAQLAVQQGNSSTRRVIDAIGPETFTYRELVRTIGLSIGKNRPIIAISPSLGYRVAQMVGSLVGDVFVTREEIEGLMQDLLYTKSDPVGSTKLSDWARQHGEVLGVRYASELARRQNLHQAYERL
jgi:NADH dehydrogenase